ncbi:hypothetical protein ACAG39_12280 [Caldicellulosiruptoraceae bacterium PP1]
MDTIGEIVLVDFSSITCEAKVYDNIPTPGRFIKFFIDDICVLAISTKYSISSIEKDGPAKALWKDKEEVKKLYPQMDMMLKGYFNAIVIGYIQDNSFKYGLPPKSISIHTLVYEAEDKEVLLATQSSIFLHTILKEKDIDIFEVIPNALYLAYLVRNKDENYLVEIGKELNMYLKYDLNILTPIIERLESLIY